MPGKDGDYKYPAPNEISMDVSREKVDHDDSATKLARLMHKVVETQSEQMITAKPKFTIGLDFDGTCVTHEFPKIGEDCPHVTDVLKRIIAQGAGLILNTMRHGDYLAAAVAWFAERGIPLYGIQAHPTQASWTGSPKCYANLFIDDASIGCPLIHDTAIAKRPFVDWLAVDRLLQQHDWYVEPIQL